MGLKAESSRFVLSYLWWVFEPILFVMIFYFVFEILLKAGRENFLLFLFCGKVPFLWFSKSVTTASNSIVQNRGIINQIDMPKALFPYISVHEALYKEWVVFLILFAVVIFYGGSPSLHWLWLLPLFLIQYGLILVCSMLGALCVCFVGDFRMLINMGMMFLMFTSGVFWDINKISSVRLRDMVMTWNPIAFLLDAYRQVLMFGSEYDLSHLAALAGWICTGVILMHLILHKFSKQIAEKAVNQ